MKCGRFSLKTLIVSTSLFCVYQLYSFKKSTCIPFEQKLKVKVLNFDPKIVENGLISSSVAEYSRCTIPKLDINNSAILNTYHKPQPLGCDKNPQNWLFVDSNNKIQATSYGKIVIGIDKMNCNVSNFFYFSDRDVKWTKEKSINVGQTRTDGDFTKIKCESGEKYWVHLFMNILPKKKLIKKLKSKSHSPSWSELSVYWFAFDSLSHMAFRRLLPKTVEYLEKKMQAIVMNGYNIVGDGTPQAYIPILTGKTELELPLTRKRYKEASYVDVYPFIWNNFSANGYVTMYGEDASRYGTFTYRLKGFQKQPTDHYTRPFFLISENHYPNYQCFGSEPQYKSWIQYGKEFMIKYPKEIPKFAVFHHSALSHDDITLVNIADEDFKAHFEELFEAGHFDNAVVFVASDHGHRFSALRETQQGQMEERLPFMSVSLPKSFKKTTKGNKIYQNLKANSDRLTTPFDIYETFLDILALPNDVDLVQSTKNRGLSLFRPIPITRTCQAAGIASHWCTCLSWQNGNEIISKRLAEAVVDTINSYTEIERKLCAPLNLKEIINSKKLVPDEKLLKYGGSSDIDGEIPTFTGNATVSLETYMITFTTSPGDAKYEATVLYDHGSQKVTVDMLNISHVNKYGDTPHCVVDKNYFLATYCVCYDKIK